ncbi:MAG: transposase [Candidatus Aminicenantaceae bacterium]
MIPGLIYHITNRCHKREYLLRFVRDKKRWLHWLFRAKLCYGLTILGYTIMSNHIHLLVIAEGRRNVVADSLALAEGRVGQEFNQRKSRDGAFWGDRYQATAVESGGHLLNCLIYIDLNSVRAGIVDHPCNWRYCGYHEILKQKQRNTLINMKRLLEQIEMKSREEFWSFYSDLIDRKIAHETLKRESKWTEAIAVGSEGFVEGVQTRLGLNSNRIKIIETEQGFILREIQKPYLRTFTPKSA